MPCVGFESHGTWTEVCTSSGASLLIYLIWLSSEKWWLRHGSHKPMIMQTIGLSLQSKSVLRGQILSYTAQRDKHLRKSFAEVQGKLSEAFVKFKDAPTLENKRANLTHKATFDALLAQMESKHTFLARARFHRLGNRPGKILSRLLKGQHSPTVINCLHKSDGSPAVRGSEISAVLHAFYADFYISALRSMLRPRRNFGIR